MFNVSSQLCVTSQFLVVIATEQILLRKYFKISSTFRELATVVARLRHSSWIVGYNEIILEIYFLKNGSIQKTMFLLWLLYKHPIPERLKWHVEGLKIRYYVLSSVRY